jgi:hypothetical protein
VGRASPIITSFNGGELSPLLAGRVEVAKYAIGCKTMEGFIPVTQGPAVARPGFRLVEEVKNSASRTWLVRFEFSEDDASIIEVGDRYMRFYANRGQIITGPSTPYEIVTPYLAADLTNADGTFALRCTGTGDEVFIVHPKYPPQLLSRFGATNWTIAPVVCSPPPFATQNSTATTVYASASTGVGVALVASAAVWTAADIGNYFYLGERTVVDVKQWEAAKAITAGMVRRSNGLNYVALNAATTGSIKPTHVSGAVYDGDSGVQWQFQDPGYGWIKITAVTDSTHATGDVVSAIPGGAVGVAQASTRWAHQAWNATDGYPTVVTFFRERLVFARDATLWFSVSGDFQNFTYQIDGAVTADSGFDRTISSDLANAIRWLSPGDVLLVGTLGDEWAIVESNSQAAFGPTNCKTARQSAYGSCLVAPERVADDTIFIQKSGRKARAMKFDFAQNGYASPDVTVFAPHVTRSKIIDMAYMQEPWNVLWACRGDGQLVGLTYNREQDVIAWHRHPLPGGAVECLECIPAPGGERDDLWTIVRYTINGVTRRFVAYLADEDNEEMDPSDWVYSDMALTYRGAATTAISGLNHLEGQLVWVLVDGTRHPDRTVTAGAITLQTAGSVVTVGLPSPATLQPMPLEGGTQGGTSQGKKKRAHEVQFRVDRSYGRAGPSAAQAQELKLRTPAVPMGEGPPPTTGDCPLTWPGGYDPTMPIMVFKDRAMPLTVCAILPQFEASEGK